MIVGAVAALLGAALFAAVAPALGRRLPPAVATRVLVGGAVAVAASTVFVVGVVAFTWVARHPAVAALGPWSPAALDRTSPVTGVVGGAATALLALLAVRTCRVVLLRGRALAAAGRRWRHRPGTLVVVASDAVAAFTTPQRRGRIVVTTALLRALDPAERRVVLAHETSHLHHRHPWWLLAAELAAAVHPLLGPTAGAAAHAVERWADEDAARAVADRRLAARTLARTALLAGRGRAVPVAGGLGVLHSDVPHRVRALLDPAPRRRPGVAALLVVVTLACVLAAATVQQRGERLFEGLLHDYARTAEGSVAGVR